MKKGNIEQARSCFESAAKLSSASFEPCFNAALLAFKLGDCEHSFALVRKALEIYPGTVCFSGSLLMDADG